MQVIVVRIVLQTKVTLSVVVLDLGAIASTASGCT